MKKLALHWQILISLLLAIIVGVALQKVAPNAEKGTWAYALIDVTGFLGSLFMGALQMIIVPLIVSSVIAGIASLAGMDRLKQMGAKTVSFYLMSTLIAASVGLMMVNLVKPGEKNGKPNEAIERAFVEAKAENSQDQFFKEGGKFSEKTLESSKDWKAPFVKMFPKNIIHAATENGQLLGLLVFSLLFGLAATQLPVDQVNTVREFAVGFNDVMIKMTQWIMAVSPIGLFGLMLGKIYELGPDFIWEMRAYMLTVIAALAIHMFIVLPLMLRLIGRVNPLRHFSAMKSALMTAFATASSSATLPVTMRCVQDKAGVSKKTASFTLPLGATVNMDGTALYECIAVIFVAQVFGVELTLAAQIGVVFAALLTSIGVAGIPSASMVAILIIMKNADIENAEMAVAGLLIVDRLLDMSRTAVNVFGDSCAAVVIAKSEGEEVLTDKKIA